MQAIVSNLCLRGALAAAACLSALPFASAQGIAPTPNASGQFPGGTWTNFESPHVKPLAIARLGRAVNPQHYLLVCNTADSHLEIYDIDVAPALPAFVTRVPVGQDPVSVYWHEETTADEVDPEGGGGGEDEDADAVEIRGTIYTANMVGDSVSRIDFRNIAGVPTATHTVTANVGDEPMDITWLPNGTTPFLIVSLNSRGAVNALDPVTLATLTPDPYVGLAAPVAYIDAPGGTPLLLDATINQPRTIEIVNSIHPTTGVSTPFFFALASRGTHHDWTGVTGYANTFADTEAGLDMYMLDLGPSPTIRSARKKLGTKNFNMTFDAGGACWVVSGDAANRAQKGKPNVAGEPTGFLRTLLHLIPLPANAAGTVLTRDLNRATTGGALGSPVAASISLSHCTDVSVFESGSTYKVYLAGFNNDLVGVIGNVKTGGGAWNTVPNTWTRNTIALPVVTGRFGGPTSLLARNATGSTGDPGNVVYVLNRFRNQIDAIDPATDTVTGSFSLARNPTPAHVAAGRKFLYSVKTGNGFNSCASCHFDGRLDGLRWDLSESTNTAPFSLQLISALESVLWVGQTDFSFTVPKGEFITQSLQGLVNFEVDEPFPQNTWFTNKPYHWDMDQANLSDFNGGGFQNLLGGPALSTAEMDAFQKFVNSIHYPPNFEQAPDRKYRGTIGTPNNEATGTLAMWGLKLFHTRPLNDAGLEGSRSCVQCHALPEGGNNLGTEAFGATVLSGMTPPTAPLPIESAPMRGLAQKEALWFNDPVAGTIRQVAVDFNTALYTSFPTLIKPQCLHYDFPLNLGGGFFPSNALNHAGGSDNINDFISVFTGFFPGTGELAAINQFTREFDVGVAPGIGVTTTINGSGALPTAIAAQLEEVRTVNCGLAAVGRIGGTARGFWFDPFPAGTPPNFGLFYDVVSGASFTPAALLSAMGASDQLVFKSTPLGMDRRFASAAAAPPMLTGSAPSNPQLESMVPNTAYENVPSLEKNWDPFHPTAAWQFVWNGANGTVTQEPWDMKALRLMQSGYLPSGVNKHHEPPRRFRVSGDDIRHGAVLKIYVPMSAPPTADVEVITLPLYPCDKVNGSNRRIWETAVEADPLFCGVFALGGYWAQGIDLAGTTTSVLLRTVVDAINESTFNGATYFNPGVWNNYTIEVVNEDGTNASVTNQQIVLEPAGFVH